MLICKTDTPISRAKNDDMERTEIGHIDVSLVDRCLSIDLEVDPGQAKIFAFAAVRNQDEKKVVFRNGNREAALDRLEQLAGEADFLLGHNIIRFDLPHLAAVRPRFAGLAAKPIDTLWLNPLAFPSNPYHHLVKHHHDGRLQAGHVNDPELDARLVLKVLANQIAARRGQRRDRASRQPDEGWP